MSPFLIVYVLFIHWVMDFLCQSAYMGTEKHKNFAILCGHVTLYTVGIILMIILWLDFSVQDMTITRSSEFWVKHVGFFWVTLLSHLATDFVTSRYNAKQHRAGRMKRLINAIGFDQWLHQAQLVFTLYYIYY